MDVEKVTLYRAADESLHESPDAARRHDIANAVQSQAEAFVAERIPYRTVSRKKAQGFLVEFALQCLFPEDPDETENPNG